MMRVNLPTNATIDSKVADVMLFAILVGYYLLFFLSGIRIFLMRLKASFSLTLLLKTVLSGSIQGLVR